MAGHLCKRALIALLTIFIIITLSFLMVRFMPGDPLIHLVGEENYYYMKEFNPQELERLAEKYAMSGTLGQQYAESLEQKGRLQGDGFVATVMSNIGLHRFCKERGLRLLCANVGDRNVLELMQKEGMRLGGEQSGH